jgi:Zn-dependent peptidase ImmA (M78 family)
LRRGFKALAERNALAARTALGRGPLDPLDAWEYAGHLNVVVAEFSSLGLSNDAVQQLTIIDQSSWSAMTLKDAGVTLIVLNPSHAPTRQPNNLMHELAHIELNHQPTRVDVSATGLLLLSDYSDDQELEADWHAGALLLPREALVKMKTSGASTAEIALHFGVSEALCQWRLRMTGVDAQMHRRRG